MSSDNIVIAAILSVQLVSLGIAFWFLKVMFADSKEERLSHQKSQTANREALERISKDAFLHLTAKNAREAVEAQALEAHEKEVLRQSSKTFDEELLYRANNKPKQESAILRDAHGNEFEIIGD